MSASGNPRITKRTGPTKPIKRRKYREALPYLLNDFDGRCAYSLQHPDLFGGLKSMEVDHFDPKKKKSLIQDYDNLLPASRHCNGSKGQTWPSDKEIKSGIRFLHPRKELDYGPHIVEDLSTGHLIGLTPAGKWQIRVCALNAFHLVKERKRRTDIHRILTQSTPMVLKGDIHKIDDAIKALKEQAQLMIPELPKLT